MSLVKFSKFQNYQNIQIHTPEIQIYLEADICEQNGKGLVGSLLSKDVTSNGY